MQIAVKINRKKTEAYFCCNLCKSITTNIVALFLQEQDKTKEGERKTESKWKNIKCLEKRTCRSVHVWIVSQEARLKIGIVMTMVMFYSSVIKRLRGFKK